MPARLYPPADAKSAWYADDFSSATFTTVEKILLHTTEGMGWPGYRDGAVAPNLTYWPAQRKWKQHFPLNRSARALCDDPSTAVRENRDNVVQVEIIAACDPRVYRKYSKVTPAKGLSPEAIGDLGEFLAFMHEQYGTRLVAAPRWLPYDASAGRSPVRMTGRQYDAFRGVLGHMHVSGNVHGDPGDLPIADIIRAANRAARPQGEVVWAPQPQELAAKPPASMINPERKRMDGYRLLRTPDNRYWGCYGLQVTHLENGDIRNQYLKVTGLTLDNKIEVTYDLLENFQRIT